MSALISILWVFTHPHLKISLHIQNKPHNYIYIYIYIWKCIYIFSKEAYQLVFRILGLRFWPSDKLHDAASITNRI